MPLPGLGRVSTADNRLGTQIHDAVQVDWTGRANSGSVVNGAAADTAALAPVSGTPAGQRALIATLRARVAQQQQIVNAHRAQDAQLASMIRSMLYSRRRGGGGGMPMGGLPFGGGGFGGGGGAGCRCCLVFRVWVVSVGTDHATRMPGSLIHGAEPMMFRASLVRVRRRQH